MTDPAPIQIWFPAIGSEKFTAPIFGLAITSDAGALLRARAEWGISLAGRLVTHCLDPSDRSTILHSVNNAGGATGIHRVAINQKTWGRL